MEIESKIWGHCDSHVFTNRYMTVCLLLIVALWMLTRMARKLMQPRPRYVKAGVHREYRFGSNFC